MGTAPGTESVSIPGLASTVFTGIDVIPEWQTDDISVLVYTE